MEGGGFMWPLIAGSGYKRFLFCFFSRITSPKKQSSHKKYFYFSLIRILIFLLPLPSIALAVTSPIGATTGSFSVSPGGAASYTIPIVAPLGTNRIQPNLSLTYNSNGSNGLLGVGWSMSGLSVIHRCGATIAVDNIRGGVYYDTRDRFCLDGERLIYIGGTEYRTQHESWKKIIASDASYNPASFTIYAKDGTIRQYGVTEDSRIQAASPNTNIVRVWALNKASDRDGNYLTISYTEDNGYGDYRPLSIAYTGNTTTGSLPYNTINFRYDPRSDVVQRYEAGSTIQTSLRLAEITVYANSTLMRRYSLNYTDAGQARLSVINNIYECGIDSVCLPTTNFFVTSGPTSLSSNNAWADLAGTDSGFSHDGIYGGMEVIDLNGDGLPDLLHAAYFTSGQYGGGNIRRAFINTGNGYVRDTRWENLANTDSGFSHNGTDGGMRVIDLNGDGLPDLMHAAYFGEGQYGGGNIRRVFINTGNGFVRDSRWEDLSGTDSGFIHNGADGGMRIIDLNGDGLPDLLHAAFFSDGQYGAHSQTFFRAFINTGNGFVRDSRWESLGGMDSTFSHNGADGGLRIIDLNGDGLPDLLHAAYFSGGQYGGGNILRAFINTGSGFVRDNRWESLGGTDSGFSHNGGDGGMRIIDLNSDGLADLLHEGYFLQGQYGGGRIARAFINTGKGFLRDSRWESLGGTDSGFSHDGTDGGLEIVDLNGDGLPDLLHAAFFSGGQYGGGNIQRSFINTGNGFIRDDGWASAIVSTGSAFRHNGTDGGLRIIDVNGDGLADLLHEGFFLQGQFGGGYIHRAFINNSNLRPNLVTSVTNGLNAQTYIFYKPLTDKSVYIKDNTLDNTAPYAYPYPYLDIQDSTYVVSMARQSNGNGGLNNTSYRYGGLKIHRTAASTLGFRWTQVTDPAGLLTTTFYNQILNGAEGTVASSETWASGVRVKYSSNNWTAVGSGVTVARLISSVEEIRELNNSVVSTLNTSYSAYDAYGNAGTIVSNSSDGWSKTTNNSYINDTVNWLLSKLIYAKVTATAPGQGSQYRESSFAYDPVYLWRLSKEIIEPNRSALTLTTTYGYDSFGNRASKILSGPDISTRTEYQLTYDIRGQFVKTRVNAAGHTERFENNHPTGAITKYTDVNNLVTTSAYDGFGRKILETRPDGTTTSINYLCWDNSIPMSGVKCPTPVGAAITAVQTITSGTGQNYIYSDILGRTVQANAQGFSGNWIYKQTIYDVLGRVSKVTHPYFASETQYCTTYSYDVLSRVRTVTEPGANTTDCNNTSGGLATTTTYNGFSTTVTNPLNQQRITVKNSQGLVVTAIDNAGTTTYTYDPFANLTRVTKSYDVGADITMGYDIRGRKISMTDPDMGNWTYGYNTLGELIWQKDAKLQTVNMTYDVLGRMKTRVLPNGEGTDTWNYDTATNGKGKLANVSNPSATETYVYDTLGRIDSISTSIGGSIYTMSYTYDAYSRPLTLAYPITGFKIYHVYDSYGYLTEIRRDTATGFRYWKADTFDSANRLTKQTLGNSLITTRAYHPVTGDLQTIKTGTSTNPISIQNSSFSFDAVDNLISRSWLDGATIRSETFGYDNLNRLTQVTGPANKTYAYYPNGNIQTKSGIGSYVYPANGIQPHAVSSISGTVNTSFIYDANGNMSSGAGHTYTWTSFNKPKTITTNGATSTTATYTYGPSGERVTQATPARSIVYIGKFHEHETEGSSVKDKSYIYAGGQLVAMYRKAADGSSYMRYFHTDHLGSVELVTNESRVIDQARSFDAFGKNRNVNGTDTTAASDLWYAKRGYTGHEHDDEIGLINMNAREYDPILGRFVTADSIVPSAVDSQGFNRYAYVRNNPLSYTDPSGHSLEKIKEVHRAYVKFQVTNAALGAYVAGGYYVGGPMGAYQGLQTFKNSYEAYKQGASWNDILKYSGRSFGSMYIRQVTFKWVGDQGWEGANNVFAHAVAGGATNVIAGGDFRSGFVSGGAGELAAPYMENVPGGFYGQIAAAALVGGTSTQLAGGSFKDGAITAAYGYLYNWLSHIHRNLTYQAAINAGLTKEQANTLATLVVNVDKEGSRTGPMPWDYASQAADHAEMHAMCGVSHESCEVRFSRYLAKQWNSNTLDGLAHYLHALQDSFPSGHANLRLYQPGLLPVGPAHIWGDLHITPATQAMIRDASAATIQAYRTQCPSCF